MKEVDESALITVFGGSPWEAELVKGLLESNGIPAALKDGLTATIAPYLITEGVTVMVNETDYEAAMEVVRTREETTEE